LNTPQQADQFGRLLAALAAPPKGHGAAVLVGYQPPLAVLELPGENAMIVVLDGAATSLEELGARISRIVGAERGGWMAVVVVGGGPAVPPALLAVDRAARDPRGLSMFHLGDGGALARVSGGPSPVLVRAARAAANTPPLPPGDAPALIARGQREREEAVAFAAQLRGRRAYVTMALVAVCVVIHLLVRQAWDGRLGWGAIAGEAVRAGQVWRLLSASFLHGSDIHLVMNMLALWSFGSFLEPVIGWRRYLVVYGLSALGGFLGTAFLSQHSSVGASGALWGLMLAGFGLLYRKNSIFPVRLARQMRQRLFSTVAINVAISFIPIIDKYAHFAGGLTGLALALSGVAAPRTVGAVGDQPLWLKIAAVLVGLALAGSLVCALAFGRPWAPA
jgi:rhomboid protease GluP